MKDSGSGRSNTALGIGAAFVMVLCCAGPVLIAAGLLGAIGGVLRNPLVVGAAIIILLLFVSRRRSGGGPGCTPPSRRAPDTEQRNPQAR